MKMKIGGKLVIGAVIAAGVGFGGNKLIDGGYFKTAPTVASAVPTGMDLPQLSPIASAVSKIDLKPSDGTYVVPMATIPWNATAGLHLAIGGATTADGSLMSRHGVKASIKRIDMYDQMIAEMVAFAKSRAAGNANPTEGIAMHIIMGDGTPNHMRALNAAMKQYGQSAEIVAITGYSRGEDKCMLPPSVKADPQNARGMTVGGVPRDGDLHICFKFAADNGIPINADARTYDPTALNIIEVDDFNKSDEKLIAKYCEDRPVVKDGARTGATAKVCQNGTATWTPGDVTVARKVGGVVSVASTREYSYQMAATIIGNKQWMEANPEITKNLIAAALEGSEQIAASDVALDKAAAIQAKNYKMEDAAYWKKYYKGVTERDVTGIEVQLGGSAAAGLADNAMYFGLQGNDNIFKKVYTVFGNIDKKYYPTELPDYLPYEQVVNTSYLQSLLVNAKTVVPGAGVTYSQNAQVKEVFSKKSWDIQFDTGKATFTPATITVLDDLLNQLSAGSMALQINGHTDSIGSEESNLALSVKRANAVKNWLITNAPSTFPAERIRARGYGGSQPKDSNATVTGRTNNRRVEILQVVTQ